MDEDELSFRDFYIEDHGLCDGDLDYDCLEDDTNISAIKESNPYIKTILQSSGLKILEEAKAINAYERQGVIGLFFLFISRSYLNSCIFKWTRDVLLEKFNIVDFTWS